ncbi:MAG: hypothetical protein ABEK02_00565 [Haloquadratum sp.]
MSSDPPEAEYFEDGHIQEIAVDGKSVARLEIINDLSMSPVDDAAIAAVLRIISEDLAQGFERDADLSVAEALEQGGPEIEVADSNGWETAALDRVVDAVDDEE